MPTYRTAMLRTLSFLGLGILLALSAHAQPVATIGSAPGGSADSLSLCIDESVTFFDLSTYSDVGGPTWTFAGGSPAASADSAVVVTYATAGTYLVILTATDFLGVDTDTLFVTVHPLPVANAGGPYGPYCVSQCQGVEFVGSPTGGLFSGPGIVVGRFFQPCTAGVGLHNIVYTYTDANGCSATDTVVVEVLDAPNAALNDANIFSPFSNCITAGGSASYTLTVNNASTTTATNTAYVISWGDGTQDSVTSFTSLNHTYTATGNYTLTLTVYGPNGCSATQTYSIFNGSNPSISAGIPGNTSGCAPFNVAIPIAGFLSNTPGTIYEVQVNDGTPIATYTHPPPDTLYHLFDSTSCGANTPFGSANSFFVRITATNACGSSTVIVEPIRISTTPITDFEILPGDSAGCINITNFQFINTSSNANYILPNGTCVNGMNTAWSITPNTGWTLNSGNLNNSNQINVTFQDTGIYTVCLETFNPCGGNQILCRTVCVSGEPAAIFEVDTNQSCVPFVVQTTNLSELNQLCFNGVYNWQVTPATGWNLVGPATLDSLQPQFEFTQAGSYTLTLTSTTDCGVNTSDTTIIAQDVPIVTLPPDPAPYCDTTVANFATEALFIPTVQEQFSAITGHLWTITPAGFSFVNGTSATDANPAISFPPGVYEVIYQATNGCGTDADTLVVTVYAPPTADFSFFPECQNDTVQFSDSTAIDPINGNPLVSWLWDFGNGLTANVQNPQVFFNAPGVYLVQLIVADAGGCSDTVEQSITIHAPPVVAIAADSLCYGSAMTFANGTTTDPVLGAPIATWAWDFGDGTTSALQFPTHTYAAPGLYPVVLTATDTNGCSHADTSFALVHALPGVDFGVVATCAGDTTRFYDSTLVAAFGGALVSWSWDFGDGNSSTLQNPLNFYAAPGTYNVSLQVADANGCLADTVLVVTINPRPAGGFTLDTHQGCSPLAVQATYTGDPGVTYSWLANGVAISSLPNPSFSFANLSATQDSTILLTLVVAASSGCTDTISDTVVVFPVPQAAFGLSDSAVCGPDTISSTFLAQVKQPATYQWLVDGAAVGIGSPTDSVSSFFLPLNATGFDSTYRLSLVVTSADGCVDTATLNLVNYSVPIASFVVDSLGCGPFAPALNNLTTAGTSWLWTTQPSAGVQINDSSLAVPQITFPVNLGTAPQVYRIHLQATNGNGCLDTASQLVWVAPKPQANFTAAPTDSCAPLLVQFTNTSDPRDSSSIATMSFAWDFGNGGLSNAQDTAVTFTNTGVTDSLFVVQLIATNAFGCSDTLRDTVVVYPNPRAEFVASDTVVCAPFLIDTSTVAVVDYPAANDTYTWNIYNGQGQLQQTQVGIGALNYLLANPLDSALVELVVTNVHGCRPDTMRQLIYTIDDPVAAFVMDQDSGCSPFTVQFTDSSTAGVSHIWLVNGNQVSTAQNPQITFGNFSATQDSSIVIALVVTAGTGCSDTLVDTLVVHPAPQSSFAIPGTIACAPDTVQLTNTSQVKQPATYLWSSPSSGVTFLNPTDANPLVVLPDIQGATDSTYTLQLLVTSADGCTDSSIQQITSWARPQASFSIGASSCGGSAVATTNASVGANQFLWSSTPSAGVVIGGNTGFTPSFTFPLNATTDSLMYAIHLVVTNPNGCSDSISQLHTVYPLPQAAFVPSDTAVCDSSLITFTNFSNPNNGEPISSMTFSWELGNGLVATSQDTALMVFNHGVQDTVYTIQLIATSVHGCVDTTTRTVRVYASSRAELLVGDTADCAPMQLDSTHLAAVQYGAANDVYEWYANGVLIGNSPQFPGYLLPQGGDSVIIRLVTSNVHGCDADTAVQLFYTIPDPVAGFLADTTEGCSPLLVQFTDTSTAGVNRLWDFGNGLVSTQANPLVSFTNTGTVDSVYTVQLVVSLPGAGCADTISQNIVVHPAPVAAFASVPACFGDSVQFLDSSSTGSGTLVSWLWDFGDGTISTDQNPAHQYGLAGGYWVTLTVTNSFGCTHQLQDSAYARPLPVATIVPQYGCFPDSACVGDTIQFTDGGTVPALGGSVTSWEWDINGDGVWDYTTSNPQHAYAATGAFQVILRTTTEHGCVDTDTLQITVSEPPTAAFSIAPNRICGGGTPVVTDSSYGYISQYNWTLYALDGAGAPVTIYTSTNVDPNPLPNLNAAFNADTAYILRLEVSNCCGVSAAYDTVRVKPLPIPYFAIDQDSGCSPHPVIIQVDGLATGNPDSIIFNFGDGSADLLLLPNISIQPNGDTVYTWNQQGHTFVYNGTAQDTTYWVTLRAINECGDSSYTLPVRVFPNNIQGFFNASTNQGCAPVTVQFNDFSFGASQVNWCLDYDTLTGTCNGVLTTGSNPVFTYNTPGTYVVAQFTANDCSADTVLQTIVVLASPTAAFTNNSFVCAEDSIFFTNQSTIGAGTIAGQQWDFGDGTTSILPNPVHFYSGPGTYTVSLITQGPNGCPDTAFGSVTIYPNPEVGFSTNALCLNEQPMQFFDSSSVATGAIISRVWDFGDGNTSVQLNPLHSYALPGVYTVSLTVLTDNFCSRTDSQLVTVYPIPGAGFNYAIAGGDSCGTPKLVDFLNTSTNAQGYYWDFNYDQPGTMTSTLVNPSFTYPTSGTYRVLLAVQNGFGCTDSLIQNVQVYPLPQANFQPSLFNGCAPLTVNFSDLSTVTDSSFNTQVVSWVWYFGDGTTSTLSNPVHTYAAGQYSVSLVVTTNAGCRDSIHFAQLIQATPSPEASFESEIISNAYYQFTDSIWSGTPPYAATWDFGDGSPVVQGSNPAHRFIVDAYFLQYGYLVCLEITDAIGCITEVCDTLYISSYSLHVPNAMVPDLPSGGEAAVFLPKGQSVATYRLQVFDRWGTRIFESTEVDPDLRTPAEPWDGTYGGEPVPQGVYFWRIDATFTDGTVWRGKQYDEGTQTNVGTITVIR